MIEATLEQIAEFSGGRLNRHAMNMKDEVIRGASIDTRTIEAGNLFIPFKGENVDGHRFIDQAFESGAAACLTEADMEDADRPLIHVEDGLGALQRIAKAYLDEVSPKTIAITGSNGKTTTKDMVECLLAPHYRVKKTIGNYNNEIGLPLTLLELDRDTEISILEMGMDAAGDIDFLSRMVEPDVAIITNVGESHIEKLGSRENIARAKYEIVNGLKNDGTFIYSRDYPLLEEMVRSDVGYTVVTAGMGSMNDHRISNVQETGTGTTFELSPPREVVGIPQLGVHNAANAALALIAARAVGLDIHEVAAHFEALKVTDMRMELRTHESGAIFVNDAYNASPSSTKSAIDTIGRMRAGHKVLVLGDILELGEYSESLHASIAEHINASVYSFDLLLTYGDAMETVHEMAHVDDRHHFDDMTALSDHLKQKMNGDSVILLKGSRGMAMERVMDHI